MKLYKIVLKGTAKKSLDKIPDDIVVPILTAIQNLAINPRPIGCKKLKGRIGYRIRSGSYRIIYEIFDSILVVEIVTVGHRKEVYK